MSFAHMIMAEMGYAQQNTAQMIFSWTEHGFNVIRSSENISNVLPLVKKILDHMKTAQTIFHQKKIV